MLFLTLLEAEHGILLALIMRMVHLCRCFGVCVERCEKYPQLGWPLELGFSSFMRRIALIPSLSRD